MNKTTLFSIAVLAISQLPAQQIYFLETEYNHSNFQVDATTLVGMGTRDDWNWPNFTFYAAIDADDPEATQQSDPIPDATLSGPSIPDGELLSNNGYGLYRRYFDFDSLPSIAAGMPSGTYTFSGNGVAGIGAFSESTNLPVYEKLTDIRVTNFNELQEFDPQQPVTISWQPFLEGQGIFEGSDIPKGGISVWIDYWDLSQNVWDLSDLDAEQLDDFTGLLPATATSVTIPADTLVGSSNGYSVQILFTRIVSWEESTTINGAIVLHEWTMDTFLDIFPKSSPWATFPQLTDFWIDGGNWLGLLNVRHAPWVYSYNEQDYVYIPDEAVFQEGSWMWVPAPVTP